MKNKILTLACSTLFLSSALPYVYAAPSVTAKENLAKLIATKSCRGCDLSGLDFNRMDLSRVNLEGADLSMSTFFLTNLSYANLKNTTLNGAVFGGADLGDADLTGADLRGVSLDSAYLGGTRMTGEIVTTKPYESIGVDEVERDVYVENQSISKKAPTQKEVKVGERRDFSETPPVIRAVDKKNDTVYAAAERQDGVKVSEGAPSATAVPKAPPAKKSKIVQKAVVPVVAKEEVTGEPVEKSGVGGVSKGAENEMAAAEVVPVVSKPVMNFSQPIVEKTEIDTDKMNNLKQLLTTNRCYGCDLSDVDIARESLEDADLEKANLSGSNLEKADLEGANLKGAILVGTNLKKANLNNADLYKANLTGADLTGARQKDVLLDGALLDGAIGLEMSLILQAQ